MHFSGKSCAAKCPLRQRPQRLEFLSKISTPRLARSKSSSKEKRNSLHPAGNIQGGFLAAMLDDTMGPALASTLSESEFAPTLNLNVCFQSAAKVGRLLGKGRVVKRGRGVCLLSAELYQDGEQVATATATALIRSLPR
jgi:acyl-coenzyme A thioesterase PaaI-like protein